MTVEKSAPEVPDGRRIAVIIGTCDYSNELLEDIEARRASDEAEEAEGAEKTDCAEKTECILYSWAPNFDGRIHVNPCHLEDGVAEFKRNRITHVLHAGAVSVNDVDALLNDLAKQTEGVRKEIEEYLRFPVKFYEKYAKLLEWNKIGTISPAGLFPKYEPGEGVFGWAEHDPALIELAKELIPTARKRCAENMRKEETERDKARIGYVPRAMVFDGRNETSIERQGTIAMLKKLQGKAVGKPRLLLKVLPDDFPPNLDCPTITPQTILHASRKHVDLIAIDRKNGLIVDREKTLTEAAKAGIVLFGY